MAKLNLKVNNKQVDWFPCAYIYKGNKTFLLWQGDFQHHCFLRDLNNKLVSADSIEKLRKIFPKENKHIKWSEIAVLDFDRFWRVLKHLKEGKPSSTKTCRYINFGFNFIGDILRTFVLKELEKKLYSRILHRVYDKLIWGSNWPAVTPEGKSYHPLWVQKEIHLMNSRFKEVWEIIREKGYIVP